MYQYKATPIISDLSNLQLPTNCKKVKVGVNFNTSELTSILSNKVFHFVIPGLFVINTPNLLIF